MRQQTVMEVANMIAVNSAIASGAFTNSKKQAAADIARVQPIAAARTVRGGTARSSASVKRPIS